MTTGLDSTIGGVCSNGFHTWSDNMDAGDLMYTFTGSGDFTIEFANCWNDGSVVAYYDGSEIEKSTAQNDVKKITESFTNGKVFKLRDEDGNSVINLISFSTCVTGNRRLL